MLLAERKKKLLRNTKSKDAAACAGEEISVSGNCRTYLFGQTGHYRRRACRSGVRLLSGKKAGLRPIVLERGRSVEQRKADIDRFWETGVLDTTSNVQFGEGGAGTFSDGKLNTLIKDKYGRCREVLSLFVKMGAPADILYKQKPHVGTDLLMGTGQEPAAGNHRAGR